MLPPNSPKCPRILMVLMAAIIIIGVALASTTYDVIATKRYQRFDESLNWINAVMQCAKHNMTLASIETACEQAQMVAVVNGSSRAANFWIGATNQHNRDEFAWLSSGQSLRAYHNWRPNYPPNSTGLCVAFHRWNATWFTGNCRHVGPFVCETRPTIIRIGVC